MNVTNPDNSNLLFCRKTIEGKLLLPMGVVEFDWIVYDKEGQTIFEITRMVTSEAEYSW